MPFKYIGRRTDFKGKTLWEIVGNLKNFGVGRIVARNMFERYPEPSYYKILKVETLPCPEVVKMDHQRKVRVLVEKTFRGVTNPKPILIESASYKTDYKLIPKDEETTYCKSIVQNNSLPVYPSTTDFPPLMKELLIREAKARGEDTSKEPKLEIVYNKKNDGKYRIATEGEKATVDFGFGIGKNPEPKLYGNIQIN